MATRTRTKKARVLCTQCGKEVGNLVAHERWSHPGPNGGESTDQIAVPSKPQEKPQEQCLYCSLFFEDLSGHQRLVHSSEAPVERPLTAAELQAQPGTITGRDTGTPRKTPWTREMIESGWQCTRMENGHNVGCKWREPRETHVCPRCGGPMLKMYPMVEYDPPASLPVTVHGVRYQLIGNQTNIVPNIVRDIAREFFRETADPLRPRQSSDPVGTKRLETTGFLPPVEEDTTY